MKEKQNKQGTLPTRHQLEKELHREVRREQRRKVAASAVSALLTAMAVAVLVFTNLLPVLRVEGASMAPTLQSGEIVVSLRGGTIERGDLLAFYYQNEILLKRVIGLPGEEINLDADGNVYIDGNLLQEPYLIERALGDCDVEFPFRVPENQYFVLGDHRSTSSDSRMAAIGCVAEDRILGTVFFRIWPLDRCGAI